MIGIFDSGIGGITVVKEILRRYPNADFVYLGDLARAPYGEKSPERICEYAKEDVELLQKHGITDIVIACNSVSATALDYLRSNFPHLTFYDVITPAVAAIVSSNYSDVAVIGTRATIASNVYQAQIAKQKPSINVYAKACPLLAPWVEEGLTTYSETDMVVSHYLKDLLEHKPDCLVLGCTHYPLLAHHIQDFLGPDTSVLSSSTALVDSLPEHLFADSLGKQSYYFTDITQHLQQLASRWLGKEIEINKAEL